MCEVPAGFALVLIVPNVSCWTGRKGASSRHDFGAAARGRVVKSVQQGEQTCSQNVADLTCFRQFPRDLQTQGMSAEFRELLTAVER